MSSQERSGAEGAPLVPGVSRRAFLGAAGTVGSAGVVAALAWPGQASAAHASAARADGSALARQRAMILRVAAAGAVFPLALPQPFALPSFGIVLSDYRPPTLARLCAAERRLPARDLARARSGAGGLIAAGLLRTGQAALLEGIARRAAAGRAGHEGDLVAVVRLAIATVFPDVGPGSQRAALAWLDLLATKHQRGTLRSALRRKGIR